MYVSWSQSKFHRLIPHFRVDKRFYKPAAIERWVVVVYERQQRFNQAAADEMVSGLLASCRDCGIYLSNEIFFYLLMYLNRHSSQGPQPAHPMAERPGPNI